MAANRRSTHSVKFMQKTKNNTNGSKRGGSDRKASLSAVMDILQKGDNDEDFDEVYKQTQGDDTSDEEDIYEKIKVQKEIIERVRYQPWSMSKKLKLISLAKSYVEKYEGNLSRSHGYHEKGLQVLRRMKRDISNVVSMFTPWEMRVKEIESHFGTVVASYFVFLRWLIWINIWLTLFPLCFVIMPELIVGEPHGSIPRKQVPEAEQETYADLKTIWDAEGILKYSVIFYGYYGNSDVIGNGYRLPLAYLLTGISAFAFSFIILLRRMAANARLNRLSEKEEEFTFSWKLFGSWDYTTGNSETANNKYASNVTTFRETILEAKHKEKSSNKRLLLLLRIIANIMVLLLLALSTYIIQLCVERSREMELRKSRQNVTPSFWEENEIYTRCLIRKIEHFLLCIPHSFRFYKLTIIMTLIATIFPNFFDLISLMEKYHPRVNLRWQLARIFALNLLNLYTLFIALFWKQQDLKQEIEAVLQNITINTECNSSSNMSTTSHPSTSFVTLTTKDIQNVENCTTSSLNSSTIASDLCWETMIGQEVFKLTIMDLVFTLGTIIIQDFLRGLFVRYCNILCCWDLEKKFPEYGDFKTAENILHLINNQGMIWLGTFFAPGLPVLNLLKLLILVYVRCWSVMVCNVPQETMFRASRSNNFYYALLLVMLFLSMLPPLFAIVTIEPSPDCGPFSGHERMFQILTDTVEKELPTIVASVLEYAVSPGVIIPVFMLLGMVIYYLVSVGRALRDANNELRTQLEYERTEGKRKIYAMANAKQQLDTDTPQGPGMSTLNSKRMGMLSAATSVIAASRVAKILTNKTAKSSSKLGKKEQNISKENITTPSSEQDTAPVAVVKATQNLWKKAGKALNNKNITDMNKYSNTSSHLRTTNGRTSANHLNMTEVMKPYEQSMSDVRINNVSMSVVNENLDTKIETHDILSAEGNRQIIIHHQNGETSKFHTGSSEKPEPRELVLAVGNINSDAFNVAQKYKLSLNKRRKSDRTSPRLSKRYTETKLNDTDVIDGLHFDDFEDLK